MCSCFARAAVSGKKTPIPYMGQESLITSAIPPNLMSIPDILSLTYHHTHLIDNGIESRPSYLEHPFRSVSPHGVHSFSIRLFRFHRPELSLKFQSELLVSVFGFLVYLYSPHPMSRSQLRFLLFSDSALFFSA